MFGLLNSLSQVSRLVFHINGICKCTSILINVWLNYTVTDETDSGQDL